MHKYLNIITPHLENFPLNCNRQVKFHAKALWNKIGPFVTFSHYLCLKTHVMELMAGEGVESYSIL